MRILIIEDNKNLGILTKNAIAKHFGYATDLVCSLEDMHLALKEFHYDIMLADVHLPDGVLFDHLKEIRVNYPKIIIIILTARDKISDKIEGLEKGADDYLVKPFNLDELIARIKVQVRHLSQQTNHIILSGELTIDTHGFSIKNARHKSVHLTAKEWVLVGSLLEKPHHIITKEILLDRLHSMDEEVESNVLEVLISRIRKKIGKESIKNIKGLGYVWGYDIKA